ncbi:hypothetical protein [Sphingomonas sp.]|uniref:hypothetical protein n=1 Tax=Sphingomonas sp. TaxID=28214 RepID=UPI003F711FC5
MSEQLNELFRRRGHRMLMPEILVGWATLGVDALPISFDEQMKLVSRVRVVEPANAIQKEGVSLAQLHQEIALFSAHLAEVVVVGWTLDSEPAVTIAVSALRQSVFALSSIYPDGFLLLEPLALPLTALLSVDFGNDDDPQIDIRHKTFKPQ